MSAPPDSAVKRVKIYVRLLGEGTDVMRPTEAIDLGNGLFEILAIPGYEAADENWEFPPGTTVRSETLCDETGEYQLAVRS